MVIEFYLQEKNNLPVVSNNRQRCLCLLVVQNVIEERPVVIVLGDHRAQG